MKTDRQVKALKIIFEFWTEKRVYPSNVDMARLLEVNSNIWGNIRRTMIKNGKLIESTLWDFELSDGIIKKFLVNDRNLQEVSAQSIGIQSAIQSKQPAVAIQTQINKNLEEISTHTTGIQATPSTQLASTKQVQMDKKKLSSKKMAVEIPILGQVIAGTDRGPDDLVVDISPSGESLLLPDIDDGQEVYALEVQGYSMESDAILPNDYVIVENVSRIDIKNNDLVVVRYLKEEFNKVNEDAFNNAIMNNDNFRGPTLKYYNAIPVVIRKDKEGNKIEEIRYQLAPKNKDKKYTVMTRYIDPDTVGRVVSIHRTVRRL